MEIEIQELQKVEVMDVEQETIWPKMTSTEIKSSSPEKFEKMDVEEKHNESHSFIDLSEIG